jgi:hypothetical protein
VRTYLLILVAIHNLLYLGIAGSLMDKGGSGHLSTYILSLEKIYLLGNCWLFDGNNWFRPPLYAYVLSGKDLPANPGGNMQLRVPGDCWP